MLRSLAEFSAHRTLDSDSDDNSDTYSDSEDSLLLPHDTEDPLYARILPQQQLDIPYIPPEMRPVRDSVFAVLYCCAMLGMLILGAIHVFSNAAPEAGGFASQIYSAITRNIGIEVSEVVGLLTGLTAASMLLAALWLLFLSYFAVAVISTISIILPVAMISLSIASLVTAVQNIGYGEYKFMSVFSIFGIISSTFVSFLLWKNRNLVLTHAKIVSLACDILKINPSLFVLSALLTLGHITFTVIWMYMFCQVMAHDSSNETYIPLFFVGMYFWTSSLVQNLERVTVSSVVGEWYFLRFEKNIKGDMTWFHFRNISYTSFGTVVFASLILGFIRFMKFIIGITRRKSGNSLIVAVIEYVNQLIDRFSTYSLSYAGITGESYSQAAYLSTRLFRRNLVSGLVTSFLSKLLHFTTRAVVSAGVGLIVFHSSKNGDKLGGYEWVSGGIAVIVPFYVTGVLTQVLEVTVDACFLAYLIDLDTGSCHSEGAHQIFSSSLK